MLIELSITALGSEMHWKDQLGEVLKLVKTMGLAYQVTPTGARVEGCSDDIMVLVTQCYERLYKAQPHILSSVRIEHDGCLELEVEAMDRLRSDGQLKARPAEGASAPAPSD
jgi:uncharacterized protein YqgV (UPF0045/DUF77 family)